MQRCVRASLVALPLIAGVLGCNSTSIGDPCVPEAIPSDGFRAEEVYLETSSVQCRTRTCMVYHLDGHPEHVISDDPAQNTCTNPGDMNLHCVHQSALQQHVFCSCRCAVGADGDVNTPLCPCTQGYTCQEIVTAGGGGVRGSYCVPCTYDGDPRDPPLDSTFPACPTP